MSLHSYYGFNSFGFYSPVTHIGTVVLLIGADLIGTSGAANWGGGANDCMSNPQGIFALCPTTLAPRPLPWGSPEFIGLGFLSFFSIILTELFGSPFLKSISIIVGLAVGCIVAGPAGYIDGSSIKAAPAITFLWYSMLSSTVCCLMTNKICSQGSYFQDWSLSTSNSSESVTTVHYLLILY